VFGFAKAKICIMDGSTVRKTIEVLFNPSEYSVQVTNNYKDTKTPGLEKPIPQFVNGNGRTLTMDLYFDTYTDGGGSDVTKKTNEVAQLLGIDSHAPPHVEFRWGEFAFRAVVEQLAQRFTMFRSDGVPVRAKLTVTFKGVKPLAEQLKEPRRNSSDKTKRRTLTADSSIWLIAAKEYGDPRYWRLIARQNRVEDPGAIRPGTALMVPPLDTRREGGPS
jgi:nucleoid-associated protein YgaU